MLIIVDYHLSLRNWQGSSGIQFKNFVYGKKYSKIFHHAAHTQLGDRNFLIQFLPVKKKRRRTIGQWSTQLFLAHTISYVPTT